MDQVRSSVRPLVTYAFALSLILGFFMGRISADVFGTIAGSVITFWFGQRLSEREVQINKPNGSEE